VVIAFWALYSLSRVRGRWRRAFAILAVAPFGVLAIAYAADWVAGGVASPAQAECTVPVSDRDLTIEDGEVAIVVDDCRPLPTDQSLPAARGSRLRNLLALAGLAVGLAAALKPLLWSTVPSFSVGLAIGLLASSLFVRPNSEWLFAADISSLVLTGLVGLAVFVMKAVSRSTVLMGALSGALIGGVGIAAGRIGEDSTPNPTVKAAIEWMVVSPGWALVAAVLLPTLLAALARWISARSLLGANAIAPRRKTGTAG